MNARWVWVKGDRVVPLSRRITCEKCGSFLGKFIEGRAAFWCHRCRKMQEIDTENQREP